MDRNFLQFFYPKSEYYFFLQFFVKLGSQQSDIVREVEEIDVLKDHLSVVFPESGPPPPWDTESYKYRCSNLEVYLKLNAVTPFKNRNEFINSIKV